MHNKLDSQTTQFLNGLMIPCLYIVYMTQPFTSPQREGLRRMGGEGLLHCLLTYYEETEYLSYC